MSTHALPSAFDGLGILCSPIRYYLATAESNDTECPCCCFGVIVAPLATILGRLQCANKCRFIVAGPYSANRGRVVVVHRKGGRRVMQGNCVRALQVMWGWLDVSAITDQLTGVHCITLSHKFLHSGREQSTNALSPASAWPRNIFLPHCHCHVVPAFCGSDLLLPRDCALMLTPGVVRAHLKFDFFFINVPRIVNNNEVM
jgi:hypothetical protein